MRPPPPGTRSRGKGFIAPLKLYCIFLRNLITTLRKDPGILGKMTSRILSFLTNLVVAYTKFDFNVHTYLRSVPAKYISEPGSCFVK